MSRILWLYTFFEMAWSQVNITKYVFIKQEMPWRIRVQRFFLHVTKPIRVVGFVPLQCKLFTLETFLITAHWQGRNEGGQGRHNSPGANSLWGRWITAGGAEKSQQCHNYFLQYSEFAFEKLRFDHRGAKHRPWGRLFDQGGAEFIFCPGRHLTSLRPCALVTLDVTPG